MKNDTKKKLFAVFIAFIFLMSSIAFVTTLFTGGGIAQQQEFKPLESFVVEGPLDQRTESTYVQGGFTSLKFYYSNDALLGFVEQLPGITATNTGQQQMIVQKIPANETYMSIVSLTASEEIRNLTKPNIVETLCRVLTVKPLECIKLNFSSPTP